MSRATVVTPPKASPEKHEKEIAWIVARHYKCAVKFLVPRDGYKTKTPDIIMRGVLWEIKSPQGNSERNIGAQFRRGLKQSDSIIIDSRRTKLSDELIKKQIQKDISDHKRVKRVIFVSKAGEVIEFFR